MLCDVAKCPTCKGATEGTLSIDKRKVSSPLSARLPFVASPPLLALLLSLVDLPSLGLTLLGDPGLFTLLDEVLGDDTVLILRLAIGLPTLLFFSFVLSRCRFVEGLLLLQEAKLLRLGLMDMTLFSGAEGRCVEVGSTPEDATPTERIVEVLLID